MVVSGVQCGPERKRREKGAVTSGEWEGKEQAIKFFVEHPLCPRPCSTPSLPYEKVVMSCGSG